ncbi:MAG: hypothetical protein MHM6MM_001434 [Cercozoa sp. M6MM]
MEDELTQLPLGNTPGLLGASSKNFRLVPIDARRRVGAGQALSGRTPVDPRTGMSLRVRSFYHVEGERHRVECRRQNDMQPRSWMRRCGTLGKAVDEGRALARGDCTVCVLADLLDSVGGAQTVGDGDTKGCPPRVFVGQQCELRCGDKSFFATCRFRRVSGRVVPSQGEWQLPTGAAAMCTGLCDPETIYQYLQVRDEHELRDGLTVRSDTDLCWKRRSKVGSGAGLLFGFRRGSTTLTAERDNRFVCNERYAPRFVPQDDGSFLSRCNFECVRSSLLKVNSFATPSWPDVSFLPNVLGQSRYPVGTRVRVFCDFEARSIDYVCKQLDPVPVLGTGGMVGIAPLAGRGVDWEPQRRPAQFEGLQNLDLNEARPCDGPAVACLRSELESIEPFGEARCFGVIRSETTCRVECSDRSEVRYRCQRGSWSLVSGSACPPVSPQLFEQVGCQVGELSALYGVANHDCGVNDDATIAPGQGCRVRCPSLAGGGSSGTVGSNVTLANVSNAGAVNLSHEATFTVQCEQGGLWTPLANDTLCGIADGCERAQLVPFINRTFNTSVVLSGTSCGELVPVGGVCRVECENGDRFGFVCEGADSFRALSSFECKQPVPWLLYLLGGTTVVLLLSAVYWIVSHPIHAASRDVEARQEDRRIARGLLSDSEQVGGQQATPSAERVRPKGNLKVTGPAPE